MSHQPHVLLQVTPPARTEIAYAQHMPMLVSVEDAAQHLGIASLAADGTTLTVDPSATTILEDLIMWATERCAHYRGETLAPSDILDYYPDMSAGGLYRLSQSADQAAKNTDPAPKLQFIAAGATLYADLDTANWALDDTVSPPVVRLGTDLPNTSGERFNPMRICYRVLPYNRTGKAKIDGTILDLVGLRWVQRGQPPSYGSDSAVERILGANLR